MKYSDVNLEPIRLESVSFSAESLLQIQCRVYNVIQIRNNSSLIPNSGANSISRDKFQATTINTDLRNAGGSRALRLRIRRSARPLQPRVKCNRVVVRYERACYNGSRPCRFMVDS